MKEEWRDDCYLVFIETVEKYDEERGAEFSSFVYKEIWGHLRNLRKKLIKDNLRTEAYVEQEKLLTDHTYTMEDTFKQSISDLTDRQQKVMRLKIEDELTEKEIASILGISQQSVSRVYHRALESLKKRNKI
jgi:RNA polymerase sigma factor (sigma-70 family)